MTYPFESYDLPSLADGGPEARQRQEIWMQSRFLRRPAVIRIIALLVALVVWQYFATTNNRVPDILTVLSFLYTEARGGSHGALFQAEFWGPLGVSLWRYLIGLLIGVPVGAVIGLLIGRSRICRGLLNDTTLVMLALPAVVWAFLAALWFGQSSGAPIVAVALTAAPFMAVNISTGVRGIDQGLVVMSNSFRVRRRRELSDLVLAGALPSAFTGLRLAFVTGWNSLLIVEWFGSASGVGFRARELYDRLRYDGFVAWILLFVVLITLLDRLVLRRLEQRWSHYGAHHSRSRG